MAVMQGKRLLGLTECLSVDTVSTPNHLPGQPIVILSRNRLGKTYIISKQSFAGRIVIERAS